MKGFVSIACTRLIETAAAKWRQEEGDYRDDITAICVRLNEIRAEMGLPAAAAGAGVCKQICGA